MILVAHVQSDDDDLHDVDIFIVPGEHDEHEQGREGPGGE